MVISNEGLIVIVVIGLIAGWLAGQLVQGTGFGIIGDIIIGIIWRVHWRLVAASAGHPHRRRNRQRDCLRHHRGRVSFLLILRVVRRSGRW